MSDTPQMWYPASSGQVLQALQGWGTVLSNTNITATNTTAAVIRSYNHYLIALNITGPLTSGSSVVYNNPNMVWWSNLALPGALPVSWDYGNANYDSGQQILGDSDGYLVDGLQLGNNFIIYKTRVPIFVLMWVLQQSFQLRKSFLILE